jgi:nucleotide-binding universal stress UspA family protein
MNNINIQHILIPIDFSSASESAVEYEVYLAKLFPADILLLHVLEGFHKYPPDWFNNKNEFPDDKLIQKKASEKLGECAKNITKKHGVSLKSILAKGNPANKIAETVEEHSIDLIVMGTHGTSGFEEFFVGHTAHKVVNISPCPVITIREGFKVSGIKSIVLPIDESLHSRQKVNHVVAIASKCKSVVHILGIIQSSDKLDVAKFNIKINAVEKAMKKAGLSCVSKIVKGNHIALEAMNYAEKVNADLLAIMTDHESDMSGSFMGAFAHQIVNHSKVPVLSIRPAAGFVSYPL